MYAYPTVKTGTAQDLMSIIVRACERLIEAQKTVLPVKTSGQRACLSAPFNLAGAALSGLMSSLPADLALSGHDALFRRLAKTRTYPFDAASPVLERGARLVSEVQKETGVAPALLSLISHPPVWGDAGLMNIELVRQAMLGLRLLRGAACRPRLVVAVDYFALDAFSVPEEGLYAGYMGLYHLGFDRLALGRGAASAAIVGRTSWKHMGHRLMGRLAQGKEVGMVLAGGVPATTRVLFAAREWIQGQRRQAPLRRDPAEVLRRLRALPDYRAFEAVAPFGSGLMRSAWRMLEGWVMWEVAGLSTPPERVVEAPAETGALTPQVSGVMARCLEALGLPRDRHVPALAALTSELGRETPFRTRFFSALASRVLDKGRPIVFLPLAHRMGMDPGVDFLDAWAWTRQDGALRVRCASGPLESRGSTPEAFALRFGRENFA